VEQAALQFADDLACVETEPQPVRYGVAGPDFEWETTETLFSDACDWGPACPIEDLSGKQSYSSKTDSACLLLRDSEKDLWKSEGR
jgi:hypothetical protein